MTPIKLCHCCLQPISNGEECCEVIECIVDDDSELTQDADFATYHVECFASQDPFAQ